MSHPHFQIFLYEPCIPQNTGNIGRLCVGFRASLIILGTPGFSLSDKERRRAGLDYWEHLQWQHIQNTENWKPPQRCFAVSKFSSKSFYDVTYQQGDSFLFGRETTGLPQKYLEKFPKIRIPMNSQIRSFNLANSVAMILSEANRQVYGDFVESTI